MDMTNTERDKEKWEKNCIDICNISKRIYSPLRHSESAVGSQSPSVHNVETTPPTAVYPVAHVNVTVVPEVTSVVDNDPVPTVGVGSAAQSGAIYKIIIMYTVTK